MMHVRPVFYLAMIATLLLSTRLIGETAEITETQIREGSQVALEYTLSDETGR